MPRKKFQKPGAPKTAAKALEFQGFLVGTPPSSQLIPVFRQRSQKQRKTRGRWQDPDQILRTLLAFVAMAMLLFLSPCS